MLNLEIIMPEENKAKKDVMAVGGNILPLQIGGEAKAVEIDTQEHTVLTENGIALLDDEPTNSQPGGAYLINMDTLYSDSITGKGKRRWYFFQLTDKKKITLYMSPTADASVDNDLVLYTLDTSTGVLTEVARSQNGPATYELLSYVGDAGIYLFCVAAYAGDTANEFSFMARLSDKWDEREGDDSIYQAKEQELNTVVKHTIDNSIDQDVSILKISQAGKYSFSLFNVPENCNYQLQLMNASTSVIATIGKNATLTRTLDAGGYILRLMSVDGTFDMDHEVSVFVAQVPSNVVDHRVWFTQDGSHCIEVMQLPKVSSVVNKSTYSIRVDGKTPNYQNVQLSTTRINTNRNSSNCSISTTQDFLPIGIAIGSHSGHTSCKNALYIKFDQAIYGEYHDLTTSDKSQLAGAKPILDGSDKYGNKIYTGIWSVVTNWPEMVLILDLDTFEAVDFYSPNWYYGSKSLANYKSYGTPERVSFNATNQIGEVGK